MRKIETWNEKLARVLEDSLINEVCNLSVMDPKAAEEYAERLMTYKKSLNTLRRISTMRVCIKK